MGSVIQLEIKNQVALITMNKPDSLNAINEEWVNNFHSVLDQIEASDQIRAAILTGAGRAFCSGGDLNHPIFKTNSIEKRRPNVDSGYLITKRIRRMPIPFIAAVNGPAVGAGMTMALACDLRIASQNAYFRLDFIKIGVLPDMGCCFFLPHLVGTSKAMQLAMLADQINADEALDFGLVSKVVPDKQIMKDADSMARHLASLPPLALRYIKRAIYELPNQSMEDALNTEAEYINYLLGTDDCREAVKSFLEKRPPRFKGT